GRVVLRHRNRAALAAPQARLRFLDAPPDPNGVGDREEIVRAVVLVKARALLLEKRRVVSGEERHHLEKRARHEELPLAGEAHHALGGVDAVADHVVAAINVLDERERPEVDAQAYRDLADFVEHREPDEERPLGVAQEGDGRAVAGVDHHAVARRHLLQRGREHVVERALELDLVADALLRIADDVDEKDAADERPGALVRHAGDCPPAQRIPGRNPFMLRIMRCMLPPRIIFIIFCICSNWLSSWFTACTGTPAPAAMRRLREALMSSGLARSCGVMELMMPSMRRNCL